MPYIAKRKASEARPVHSNSEILKTFTKLENSDESLSVKVNTIENGQNSAVVMYEMLENQS